MRNLATKNQLDPALHALWSVLFPLRMILIAMRQEDPDEEVAFLVSGSDPSRKNMIVEHGSTLCSDWPRADLLVTFCALASHQGQGCCSDWLLLEPSTCTATPGSGCNICAAEAVPILAADF